MTDAYFFDSLGGYAVGTVLVACVVTACVCLLKKTILKKYTQSPFMTFLPFLLGMAVYALYYCIARLSLECFLNEAEIILKQGFSVGCLSAVISAFLDKITGKSNLTGAALVVRKLLEGFISENDLDAVAKKVAESISTDYSDEDVRKVKDVLIQYKTEKDPRSDVSEAEMLARLIVETLKNTA